MSEVISSFRAGPCPTDEFPVPSDDQNGVPRLKAYLDFAALASGPRRGRTRRHHRPRAHLGKTYSRSSGAWVTSIHKLGAPAAALTGGTPGTRGVRAGHQVRRLSTCHSAKAALDDKAASAGARRDLDHARTAISEDCDWVRDRRGRTAERLRAAIEAAVRGDTRTAPRAPGGRARGAVRSGLTQAHDDDGVSNAVSVRPQARRVDLERAPG